MAGTGGGQHPFFNEDIFGDFFSGFGQGGDMDFNSSSTSHRTGTSRHFRSQTTGKQECTSENGHSIKEAMTRMRKQSTTNYQSVREEFATVKIPAGVQHGVTFKFAGMGDDSIKNVPRGDLMVHDECVRFRWLHTKGNDLYTDKTIDCFQAVRGHKIQLRTLEDSIITVKVPAGTQPGTLLQVKGKGMPVHKNIRNKRKSLCQDTRVDTTTVGR